MATDYLTGTAGDDWLDGGDGPNVYDGGAGNDNINGMDGQNVIHFDAGDGVDTVSYVVPRTYQYADFITQAQVALVELATFNGTTYSNAYFGDVAPESLLYSLPSEIADVLLALRPQIDEESGAVTPGGANPLLVQNAMNALVAWINTPVTNVVELDAGITLDDLIVQVGDMTAMGVPREFAVSIGNDEGVLFQLGGSEEVAGDASTPPNPDIEFRFADGTSISMADLLSQATGTIGYHDGSAGDDVLVGSIGTDTLVGNEGNDEFRASAGFDYIAGGDGNDAMAGGPGNDLLYGEGGDDVIAGGADGAHASGGIGSDVYTFNAGDGPLVIDNAGSGQPGEVDTISFGKDIDPSQIMAYVDPWSGMLTLQVQGTGALMQMQWFDPWNGMAELANQVVHQAQFIDADGNVRIFDLAALVGDRKADLTAASASAPVFLFDAGSAAYEMAGVSAPAGGDYAMNYALRGDLFDYGPAGNEPADTNTAPEEVGSVGDQTAAEDALFNFTLPAGVFTDADGDALTFSASGNGEPLPDWLSFDPVTGTFTGTPGQFDVGSHLVTVTATDPNGAEASTTFRINVTNTNDAPVIITLVGDQVVDEDSTLFINVANAFDDLDPNDPVAVSMDGPAWLNYDAATGMVSGTPVNNDVGATTVTLTATDAAGAHVSQSFTVTVNNVNDAPTADNPIADQSVDEDATFSISGANVFGDVDAGDSLSVTMDGPAWLNYDAATGMLSGTPVNNDVGATTVTLTATDTAGAHVSQSFTVTINNVNDAPELVQPISDQTAMEGQWFSLAIPAGAFRDVDAGDSLTYGVQMADGSDLPSWLTYDPATMMLSGTPEGAPAAALASAQTLGAMRLKVIATDRSGAVASGEFSLSVAAAPVEPPADEPGQTLRGTRRDDVLTGGTGDDLLKGLGGHDILDGGAGDDTLKFYRDSTWSHRGSARVNVGSPGYAGSWETVSIRGKGQSQDVFIGGDGTDTLEGTGKADAILLDDFVSADAQSGPRLQSIEIINAGGGSDVVDLTSLRYDYGDVTIDGGGGDDVLWSSSGNDVLLGGSGSDRMDGGAGKDYLYGGSGNDRMSGGEMEDILQGGSGRDTLKDLSPTASSLLDGGSGDDVLEDRTGSTLFIGGRGNDTIRLGGGSDIIAFNRGDGSDSVVVTQAGDATLSLGAGIRVRDLAFRRSGDDLRLDTGGGGSITFDDWYRGSKYQAVSTLQLITEGIAGSGSVGDDAVELYDFKALVSAFDTARRRNPGVSKWALTNSLAGFELDGLDHEALGGDLAYIYGTAGSLAGVGVSAAQEILSASAFGKEAQALRSREELSAGAMKLV